MTEQRILTDAEIDWVTRVTSDDYFGVPERPVPTIEAVLATLRYWREQARQFETIAQFNGDMAEGNADAKNNWIDQAAAQANRADAAEAKVERLQQIITQGADLLDAAAEQPGSPEGVPLSFVKLARGLASTLRDALVKPA